MWAPLRTFYLAKMNAAEASSFNAATGPGTVQAPAGDYSVLQAMHVNTKEIPFWTWQTFWWQSVATSPNNAIYPADYKKPIAFFTDPTYFNDQSTNTDFSWAVAGAP